MDFIKSCFPPNGTQKVWIEDGKIKVAITEDENWWANKCILHDWFFDYGKFEDSGYEMDCESYGVFVFWIETCMKCNTCHEGNWCLA